MYLLKILTVFVRKQNKAKARDESLSLIAEWKMHWRLFPLRQDLNEKILTPRTLFSLSMLNTHACYRLLINSRTSLQNTSQALCQSSDSSRSSSSDSSSSSEGRRTARQKAILPARSPPSKSDSHQPSRVSVPYYLCSCVNSKFFHNAYNS